MIVVDASAVVDAFTTAGKARERLSHDDLFAPHLVDLEVLQTLRRHVRMGMLEPGTGGELLQRLRSFGITRYPVYGLTERIWELRDNLTIYDASYVAVAEALECSLVTTDARLARAPGLRCSVTVLPD